MKIKGFIIFYLISIALSADVEYCQVNADCPNDSGSGDKCGLLEGSIDTFKKELFNGTVTLCVDEQYCGKSYEYQTIEEGQST